MQALMLRIRLLTLLGCASLIAMHYVLGLSATLNKCTAFDEILHITSGYSYNRFGDFRLQPENGMLPQRWVALPWLWHDLPFPPTDSRAWQGCSAPDVGDEFFYKLGNDADKLLLAARAMNGLWSVAFGTLLFVWTHRIFGIRSAWLTLVLWSTSPIFLTHDFIATSDASTAFFFLASVGSIWSAIHCLTWGRLAASVAAIAALFLCKFSAPIILPMGMVMAITRLLSNRPWQIQLLGTHVLRLRRQIAIGMLALVCVFATTTWCAIWVGYGVRFSAFNPAIIHKDQRLVSWDTWLEHPDTIARVVAVAGKYTFLPEAYLYGFLHTHMGSKQRNAFLLGEFSTTGWASFFPLCELFKTPTGTLLLIVLTSIAIITRVCVVEKKLRYAFVFDKLYCTTPLWSLFLIYWFFAISSHLNIGHRHILPAEGPLLMFAGIAAWWLKFVPRCVEPKSERLGSKPYSEWIHWRFPIPAALTIGCLIATVSASLSAWPNYLAFFNLPSGGPKNGWTKLLDSSLDWGQELPSLQKWLKNETSNTSSNTSIYLSYFGTGDPNYYGIQATLLPCFFDRRSPSFPIPLTPGIYCISASMLQGLYTEFPGAWTPEWESDYRELRQTESMTKEQAFQSVWPTLTEAERINWVSVFRTYEQLRFLRLTHLLRRRQPDAHVNYSILIYRVDAAELAKALDEPSDAVHLEQSGFLDKL